MRIVRRWWSAAIRIASVAAIAAVAVAVVLVMRQADADAPPPRFAASLQVDAAPTQPGVAQAAAGGAPTDRIDAAWAARVAEKSGIPVRALLAYASADLTVDTEQPGCGLGWNTVAAIGSIESVHGSIRGSQLGADGFPVPAIRGPALDGDGFAAIRDSDGGAWDGDSAWDRAVGPMQFIPTTWAKWGADGNGDGDADPNQIDDAALATARYLCASGDVTGAQNWRAAVFSYNHLDSYVDEVASRANRYAAAG
jgi:membrane-bound lytic murein transglycosylase B